jgi:hypothetical protein
MLEDLVSKIASNTSMNDNEQQELLVTLQTLVDAKDQLNSLFGIGTLPRLSVRLYSGGIVAGTGSDPDADSTTFTGTFLLHPPIILPNGDTADIGGMAAGVVQWYGNSANGKFYTGAGAVVFDEDGISILVSAAEDAANTIKFVTEAEVSRLKIFVTEGGGNLVGTFEMPSVTSTDSQIAINVDAPSGQTADLSIVATAGSLTSAFSVNDEGVNIDLSLSSSGSINILGSMEVSNVRAPGSAVLADDTVLSFAPKLSAGVILVSSNPTNDYVWAFYNTAGAIAAGPISANTVVGTGILTNGTSDGVDGKLNVHVHTDGLIYIKNRRGANRGVYFTLM